VLPDRRSTLLIALLTLYLASALGPTIAERMRRGAFDPFMATARALDERVAAGRYREALRLAIELEHAYPHEPQIPWMLARIHHGLEDAVSEAAAWERYVATSAAPDEACPALPEAYERAGRRAESLRAYEQCARFDPQDAEPLIDLGEAYARAGRPTDAAAAFERADQLDPDNPVPSRRLHALAGTP
jgi:tetratricopeptide (TPR) repeat protein